MKNKLLLLVSVVVLGSCSAPKYTYKFDYQDYNAGRKERQAMKEVAANPGPVEIQPEALVAEGPVVSSQVEAAEPSTSASSAAPLTMTKAEKKGMVKELKQAMKQIKALKKSGDVVQTDQSTKAMDADLKMSLIFLVASIAAGLFVGVNATIFGIIASILFIIALIFFIKWLMKQ